MGQKVGQGRGGRKGGAALIVRGIEKLNCWQGEGGPVQQNFQHLPEHVMNANMKRRGQKRRERSEKRGLYFERGCYIWYSLPIGHKVEHTDT